MSCRESFLDFTHLKEGRMFDGFSLCGYNLCMWMKAKCERTEVFPGYFMNRRRKQTCAKTINVPEISHDEYCTLKSAYLLYVLVTYELKSHENMKNLPGQ